MDITVKEEIGKNLAYSCLASMIHVTLKFVSMYIPTYLMGTKTNNIGFQMEAGQRWSVLKDYNKSNRNRKQWITLSG